MEAKELIENACKATGLTVEELAARLDYKSLKRAAWGEIPLPESKRKHIADIVRLHELENRPTTIFVDGVAEAAEPKLTGKELRRIVFTDRASPSPREHLRDALSKAGLTPAKLAKRINYDAGVIENVVNGGGRISEAMAEKIVAILDSGLTVEELLAGSDSPRVMDPSGLRGTVGARPLEQLPGKGRTRIVPLLSWAAAGQLSTPTALDEGYDGEGVASSVPGRAFAVEIEGDSMYPEISPGDYAVARFDAQAHPGQVVLVQTLSGQVWCKRYATRDGGRLVILSSVNNSYQPIEVPADEIAWIYPVKQIIRNY